VLCHLQEQGYQFLYWHKKIFKTEIDLVFLSRENNLVLVEVKSLKDLWNLPFRLTPKQRNRLERCRLLCETTFAIPTELIYAYVHKNEIIIL
jgi:Holliday junction resolvase-like predicted endonuclease